MHSNRPSFTSMVVAGIRAVYSEFPQPLGLGPDPLATSVLPTPFLLPSYVASFVGSSSKASAALHRVYGTVTFGMTYHLGLRTRAIDDVLRASLTAGAKQIVLLGAGLDGRAFRMAELEGVKVYEVDHPSTQRDKRERLSKTNLHEMAELEFVSVDFEKDEVDVSLENAGFSRKIPSFWIWEGVTAYLTRDAITSTLRAVARASAPGSRLALTYARPPSGIAAASRPVVYGFAKALVFAGSAVLGKLGESVRGFMESSTLAELADEAGFVVRSDENAEDWAKRYWPGEPFGPFEWERIAVLERLA